MAFCHDDEFDPDDPDADPEELFERAMAAMTVNTESPGAASGSSSTVTTTTSLNSQDHTAVVTTQATPFAVTTTVAQSSGTVTHTEPRVSPQCEELCTICLEKLDNPLTTFRTGCNHVFHTRCFNKWARSSSGSPGNETKCPVCRQAVLL